MDNRNFIDRNNDFTNQGNNGYQPNGGYQPNNYQPNNYQQPNYQQGNYQQPNYQQGNYQQPYSVEERVDEGLIANLILGEVPVIALCSNGNLVAMKQVYGNDLLQGIYNTLLDLVPTYNIGTLNMLTKPEVIRINGELSQANIDGCLIESTKSKGFAVGHRDLNSLIQLKQVADIKEIKLITPTDIYSRAFNNGETVALLDETIRMGVSYFAVVENNETVFFNYVTDRELDSARGYLAKKQINNVVDFTAYYPMGYRPYALHNIGICFDDQRYDNYTRNKLFIADLMCTCSGRRVEDILVEKERASVQQPASFNENQFMPHNDETVVIDREEMNRRIAEENGNKKGLFSIGKKRR